jgi:hypothetical protein
MNIDDFYERAREAQFKTLIDELRRYRDLGAWVHELKIELVIVETSCDEDGLFQTYVFPELQIRNKDEQVPEDLY